MRIANVVVVHTRIDGDVVDPYLDAITFGDAHDVGIPPLKLEL